MLSLSSESAAARKQISASKQGWLPKLELGYRRNTESGTPFNGVVVGFSFPLFENRNKVKIAKAQSLNLDYQKENATFQAEATLAKLYSEAQSLQTSIQEYREAFSSQQDLALLKHSICNVFLRRKKSIIWKVIRPRNGNETACAGNDHIISTAGAVDHQQTAILVPAADNANMGIVWVKHTEE